jgi:hypothetical protein
MAAGATGTGAAPIKVGHLSSHLVIGVSSSLSSSAVLAPSGTMSLGPDLAALGTSERPLTQRVALTAGWFLPLVAAFLVTVPVFLQAPWVRIAPASAVLFTAPILTLGILLERHHRRAWSELGAVLVGFSGSWLAGCLFWGWCRMHPVWHLPIEAFALPLALAGLNSRWRMAGAFYLASLVGTAATDGVMALTGVMPLWPRVVAASLAEAGPLLKQAAQMVIQPLPLLTIGLAAGLLMLICRQLWRRGGIWRVSAAALATTLAVDGLFLAAALLAPGLSGLI